jgi:hypothetical protein
MRVISLSGRKNDVVKINGAVTTDRSLDLLADKFVNAYAGMQAMNPGDKLLLVFEFDFLSAVSRILVARFLKGFATHCKSHLKFGVEIEWRYDYEDEDMEEFGEMLSAFIDLNFHFVQTDSDSHLKAV